MVTGWLVGWLAEKPQNELIPQFACLSFFFSKINFITDTDVNTPTENIFKSVIAEGNRSNDRLTSK